MKNKIIKAIIACVLVAGIGFEGYNGYNAYFTKKPVQAAAMYYSVSAKKMNLSENIQGTGAAYAAITKDVVPNNNGILKNLSVKVGDTVTAEQKLFVSDSDDVRKGSTTAQNNLTKAKLTLSSDESVAKVDSNKIAMDNLSISDAQAQVNSAYAAVNNMTVTAPIGGVITAVNNSNGDSAQSSKSVLTIVDMSSMKIKVAVDELDIEKVNVGQSASVKFDAIKDKTYEGSVESISPAGTTSNNVTTYDVVVGIKNPEGIKLGMNANVTISVENKDNTLAIPTEALITNNGKKYVRVESADSSAAGNNVKSSAANTQGQSKQTGSNGNSRAQATSNGGKMVEIKTGLETQNYIEVTEGLNEGDKVLVQLPQTSSSNNNSNNRNSFGGNMGGFGGNGGNFGGNAGSQRQQTGGSNKSKN